MARKPRPDMTEGLGGFETLYTGGTVPPPVEGDPGETAPGTAPDATERAPKPAPVSRAPKAVQRAVKTEMLEKSKWGQGRLRNTRSFSLTDETFDRMRRAVAAEGFSMSELAERAIIRALDLLEEKRGGAYPPVPEAKKSGALDDL